MGQGFKGNIKKTQKKINTGPHESYRILKLVILEYFLATKLEKSHILKVLERKGY